MLLQLFEPVNYSGEIHAHPPARQSSRVPASRQPKAAAIASVTRIQIQMSAFMVVPATTEDPTRRLYKPS